MSSELPSILKIVDLKRHSSFHKAVKVTALVIRFTEICHKKKKCWPVTNNDINLAKNRLLRDIQQRHYQKEIQLLSAKEETAKRNPSIIMQLGLYLADDDGLLHCRGRLENSQLSMEAKNPILLPKSSRLTELIVLAAHVQVLHNGVRETLTEVRQNYWIPQGRQLIKNY